MTQFLTAVHRFLSIPPSATITTVTTMPRMRTTCRGTQFGMQKKKFLPNLQSCQYRCSVRFNHVQTPYLDVFQTHYHSFPDYHTYNTSHTIQTSLLPPTQTARNYASPLPKHSHTLNWTQQSIPSRHHSRLTFLKNVVNRQTNE